MYWNIDAFGLSNGITGVLQLAPLSVLWDKNTAADAAVLAVRNCTHEAYRVPSTGAAAMLGVWLQRKPPGEVELNDTVWFRGTVATVPDTGKEMPQSVAGVHMTFLATLITPPQEPRCHASTMAPFCWI